MKKYWPLFLPAVTFFIIGVATLSDYGINWDAPVHYMRGQAYLDFFLNQDLSDLNSAKANPIILPPRTTISRYYFAVVEEESKTTGLSPRPLPQKDYKEELKKSETKFSFYQHKDYDKKFFLEVDSAGGHLPLVAILSAFSNRLFFGLLGWLGDIESYQIIYLLISALGIFLAGKFTLDITNSAFAALITSLSLGLFPLFFGDSHLNMKDPEQATFFAGAVWSFWRWVRRDRLGRLGEFGWWWVFVGFVALALGVKWNIIFLPLIILPWLFLIRKTEQFKAWFRLGKLGKLGGFGGLGIILFLILIYPYAWFNPIKVFITTANYYIQTGVGKSLIQPEGFILPGGFNIYPLLLFLTQTPEIILILGGLGVIWVTLPAGRQVRERGGNLKTGYLLLFWLLVPLIRLSLPGTKTYGGLRQIMEILPAMAVLAGIGGSYLLNRFMIYDLGFKNIHKLSLRDKSLKSLIFNLKSIFLLLVTSYLLLLPIWKLHPNQNTYFNSLAGGLTGAKEKNLIDWTLSYGNIYKQGVEWLNLHAEKNANLAHLAGSDFAISPLWLREDISISPDHFSGFEQKGEYILALFNPLDPPVFAKRYPEKFLKPIHNIEMDGMPLLFIYKNEKRFNLLELDKEKELDKFITQKRGDDFGDFWQITLDREYQVSRIWVSSADDSCAKQWSKIDEVVFFIPQNQIDSPIDPASAFVLNEKRVVSGKIEYDFPAEKAQIIRIYPQGELSCFAKGQIKSVSVISQ